MNFKTWWPFKKYYQAKEDMLYYRERHNELNDLINERNKELNKYRLEVQRLWKDRVEMTDAITKLQGKLMVIENENKRMAEVIAHDFSIETDPKSDDKKLLEMDNDDVSQ